MADGWNEPTIKDPLSTKARGRKPRARKDTRRWCKGKVGVEHTLAIVPDSRYSWMKDGCRWVPYTVWGGPKTGRVKNWRWSCQHHEVCSVCGKHFRSGWDFTEECPDFIPLLPPLT
jgi:hypothetical protein